MWGETMVQINKKFLIAISIFALIGLGFIGNYIYSYYISDQKETNQYFKGYMEGSRIEERMKQGYYDGLDYSGVEPTANELLDIAIDAYTSYLKIPMKVDDMESAGLRDGYIHMYMYYFIEGINSR
jgi:hypothetical protein